MFSAPYSLAKSVKVNMSSKGFTFRQDIKKNIFPKIYDKDYYRDNKHLNPIKLISHGIETISSKIKIQITFELLVANSTADVFLFLNGVKNDMYYSIPSGRHTFNIYPKRGKNIVEIYYLVNGYKSSSVYKNFVRK